MPTTTQTASRLTLLVLILAVVTSCVSAECWAGYWGTACEYTCHCVWYGDVCNPVNGSCPYGCVREYWGANCSIPTPHIDVPPLYINSTNTTVTVEFPASSPRAEEYRVEYGVDYRAENIRTLTVADGDEDRYTVTLGGLTPLTRYKVRVVPYRDGRRGIRSDAINVTTSATLLATPLLVSVNETSVTIEFRVVSPGVDGYLVEYSEDADFVRYTAGVTVPDTGTDTYTATQGSLTPRTRYRIRYVPISSGSSSHGPSDVLYVTTSPSPHINARPLQLNVAWTSVTIQFQASSPRADQYLVLYARGHTEIYGEYKRGVTVPDTNKETYTVTPRGLEAGTDYSFMVMPYSEGRPGTASDPLFITTLSLPGIRGRPLLLDVHEYSVTFSFPAASPPAKWYYVEYGVYLYSDRYEPYIRGIKVLDTHNDTYTVTQGDLVQATSYRIRLVPYVPGASGQESDTLHITTIEKVFAKPTLVNVTESSVTITFPASTPRVDEYRMGYNKDWGFYVEGVTVRDSNKDTYTVTQEQLRPDTNYSVIVFHYSSGTKIGASAVINVTTSREPWITSRSWVINVTETSVTIVLPAFSPHADGYLLEYAKCWADFDCDGYNGTMSYYVQNSQCLPVPDIDNRCTVTLTKLTPGTRYKYRIVPYLEGRRGSPHSVNRDTVLTEGKGKDSWPPGPKVTSIAVVVGVPISMATVFVVASVIIYCFCCRKVKLCQNSSQSTELNTVQGLHTAESGATPHSPSTAGNSPSTADDYVQSPVVEQPPPYDASLHNNVPSVGLPEYQSPYNNNLNIYVRPMDLPEHQLSYNASPDGSVHSPSGPPPYCAVYPEAPPSYREAISGTNSSYI